MTSTLDVLDQGRLLAFSFDDLLKYHGPGSPGGVAQGFKVLERGLPLLDPDGPCEQREIHIRTSFGGPGEPGAYELVTRAVTGDRFVVDQSLARPERGFAAERFVFELTYRDSSQVTLLVRDGIVPDEFIRLARAESKTDEQKARFAELKLDLVERLMPMPADEVYGVDEGTPDLRRRRALQRARSAADTARDMMMTRASARRFALALVLGVLLVAPHAHAATSRAATAGCGDISPITNFLAADATRPGVISPRLLRRPRRARRLLRMRRRHAAAAARSGFASSPEQRAAARCATRRPWSCERPLAPDFRCARGPARRDLRSPARTPCAPAPAPSRFELRVAAAGPGVPEPSGACGSSTAGGLATSSRWLCVAPPRGDPPGAGASACSTSG